MAKTFLSIKRRDYPALGASPNRDALRPPVYPSRFFLTTPPEATMQADTAYQDVPFAASKIKHTQDLIRIFTANVSTWEASEPTYPLLPRVKDQLKRELKTLADVTGGRPCL